MFEQYFGDRISGRAELLTLRARIYSDALADNPVRHVWFGRNGWLFLNLKDGVPVVESLARLGNREIPAEVDDNLRPLRSALVYGSRNGDLQDVVAFVQTS